MVPSHPSVLHFGSMSIAGVLARTRLLDVVRSGPIAVSSDPGPGASLRLHFSDNNLGDNRYGAGGIGVNEQCVGLENAWVVVVVQPGCAGPASPLLHLGFADGSGRAVARREPALRRRPLGMAGANQDGARRGPTVQPELPLPGGAGGQPRSLYAATDGEEQQPAEVPPRDDRRPRTRRARDPRTHRWARQLGSVLVRGAAALGEAPAEHQRLGREPSSFRR